jgi:uncharacterized UBP type Zn finger protein
MKIPDGCFQCVKCGDIVPSPAMGPYDGKCCHCFDSDDDGGGYGVCPLCGDAGYCNEHGLCNDCNFDMTGC